MSRSPGSNMNITSRPSQMNIFGALQNQTPNKKPSGMNLNNDLGGGTFLTETKLVSRMNQNTKSPDGRKTSTDELMNMSPSPNFLSMTNHGSP